MRTRRSALAGLLAATAALAVAAPASATIIYTATLSGTYEQDWQVHDDTDCVTGGGTQVVRFATPGRIRVGGSTPSGDPRWRTNEVTFAPFAVRGTIARTDTTAPSTTADCDGSGVQIAPHDCGGPRSFRISDATLFKSRGLHRAKLHLDLTGLDPTFTSRGIAGRLFKDTRSCFDPDSNEQEGSAGLGIPWPGNAHLFALHRTFHARVSEPYRPVAQKPTYLPGGSEAQIDSSESLHYTVRLRSTCYRDPTLKGLRCSKL